MPRSFLLASLLLAVPPLVLPARAAIESTVDEWADRFLPERGPKIRLPSYAGPLDRAAAEVRAGKYRAALATLYEIQEASPTADVLRARALFALGERERAMELLSDPALANDAAALSAAADMAIEAGSFDQADRIISAYLKAFPDTAAPHYYRGQLHEARGEFEQAIAAYKWSIEGRQSFLQKWQANPNQFENADELSLIAAMIDRWATLSGAYKEVQSLNDTVLAMFVRAFDVIDRQHVPSRLRAAQFALAHGDREKAGQYLEPLMAEASGAREVQVMVAELASGNTQRLLGAAAQLRRIDPLSFDAGQFEVLGLLQSQQPVQAADRAAALLKQYPRHMEALGLWAATQYLIGNEGPIAELPATAESIAPRRGDALAIAAQVLAERFQRQAAERLFQAAIAKTPWDARLYHGLGDIYLNDSRDDQARAVLEQAYAADPYNLTTVNYLRLLDGLEKYTRLETEHYTFFSDTNADPIAAQEMAPFMEEAIADLKQVFDYLPPEKMIVQIFPTDDEFSVRMAGIPGIENFGVSFGRALATIAPRKGTRQGNFNWARVLRHELVHTVNLMQTHNRCPRWLTEGLAVWQEGVQFRFANVPPELYKRAMEDDLFTIRGLQTAFISPKKASDGEQAYTQGAWLARYMEATHGRESIVKLLNAYGQSKSDADAFRIATGQELPAFEQAWHAWMKQQLRPWGYDEKTTTKVKTLLEEGESLIKQRAFAEALPIFEEANRLQPTEARPHQRLAAIYLQKETANADKAIEHLKFLHVLELQNNRLAKQIARMYLRQEKLDDALHWANESTYVDLYDAGAYELKADIYDRMNRPADAARARETAARIKLWDQTRDKSKEPTAD